jgi:hypothetical protein
MPRAAPVYLITLPHETARWAARPTARPDALERAAPNLTKTNKAAKPVQPRSADLKTKQTAKKGTKDANEKEIGEEVSQDARFKAIEGRQGRQRHQGRLRQQEKQKPVLVALTRQ